MTATTALVLIPIFLFPVVIMLFGMWKTFLEARNKVLVEYIDVKGDKKKYKVKPSAEGWVTIGDGDYRLNPEGFYRSGLFGQWKTALCVAGANTNLKPSKPMTTGRKLKYGDEEEQDEKGEELNRDILSPEEIADSRVIPLTVREIYFGKVMSVTSIITLMLALVVVGVSFYNANIAKNYGDYIQESNEATMEKIEGLFEEERNNTSSMPCFCVALPNMCGFFEMCSPALLQDIASGGQGLMDAEAGVSEKEKIVPEEVWEE